MTTADSGTQPEPHYCEHTIIGRGEGCPVWPACLGTGAGAGAGGDPSYLTDDLATLAGFAAGAVLFLIIAIPLLSVLT